MANVDLETGFKRIVWIVALIGAVGGFAIFVYGAVTGIKNTKQLNHYRTVMENINKGDPDFIALNKADQKYILKMVNDKIEEFSKTEDWKSQIYGGLGLGVGWFLMLWMLFFIIRWIVKGFIKDKGL